jgi:hypothetical protein
MPSIFCAVAAYACTVVQGWPSRSNTDAPHQNLRDCRLVGLFSPSLGIIFVMPTDHGIDTGTTIEAAVHQLRLTWFGRLIGELVHFKSCWVLICLNLGALIYQLLDWMIG